MSEEYYNSAFEGSDIDAAIDGCVRGDISQSKDSNWKTRARNNIGAASATSLTSGLNGKQDKLNLPLSIANGGTGASTAKNAMIALTDDADSWTGSSSANQRVLMRRPNSLGVVGVSHSWLAAALWKYLEKDDEPTEGSGRAMSSGGVFKALNVASASGSLVLAALPRGEASGSIASFPDGADGIPVKSLLVDFGPIQAGSGDPSPSNVRAISGVAGTIISRMGKNLLDDSVRLLVNNTQLYIGNNNEFSIHLKAGTYTLSATFLNGEHYAAIYREKNDTANTTIWTSTVATVNATITVPEGEYKFWLYKSSGVVADNVGTVQLEFDSVATEYEPYTCSAIPISWESDAGTVYGGTLDVLSGVLTVMCKSRLAGEFDWSYSSSGAGFFATSGLVNIIKRPSGNTVPPDKYLACDIAVPTSANGVYNQGDGNYIGIQGSGNLRLRYTGMPTSASEFKQAVNNVRFIFPLAEPETYQLTQYEVLTLLGYNNICSTVGNTSVVYRADPNLYIDKRLTVLRSMIAPVEDTGKATQNYNQDTFLWIGETLYITTNTISSGDSLAVGTNITPTTLSQWITIFRLNG